MSAELLRPITAGKPGAVSTTRPPGSAGLCFEQLLLFARRAKTVAVAPRSVHAFMGYGSLDYEARKAEAVRRTNRWTREAVALTPLARRHDVADAVCCLLYYADRRRREEIEAKRREAARRQAAEWRRDNASVVAFLEQFRYSPPPTRPGCTRGGA